MKILISGGSGFIGKLIQNNFLNHEIVNIDRTNIHVPKDTNMLIHLAGIAHDMSSKFSYEDYIDGNYKLTKDIFKEFLKSDASNFIFFSTSKIYGNKGFFDEDSLTNPKSYYAESKLKAESFLISNSKTTSKSIIILRPSLIYSSSDSMKGNLLKLSKMIDFLPIVIFPKINNKRSFCSIENIYSLIKFLEFNKLKSGIYNISDDKSISTHNLVKEMSFGKKFISLNKFISKILIYIMLRLPKINKFSEKLFNDFVVDNTKIKKATGLSFEKNNK